MRIERVTETTLCEAGEVHALAWAESHRSFCSAEFVALHTPKRQTDYLRQEMAQGKALFLLRDDIAVGVVSVRESLIENLYVRPDRQSRGYGSALLRFAIRQCNNAPTLWVLINNLRARALYERYGFRPTGEMIPRKNGLYELEMRRSLPQ